MTEQRRYRNVNRILGEQPKLGPFPADQIFPWGAIGIVNLIILHYMLDAGWLAVSVSTAWGWATYWTLSSNKRFFGKFIGVPRLSKGYMKHQSLITPYRYEYSRNRKRKRKRKKR
ncbi:MAG: hypothetical protein AAF378_00685 [Cyanobacteria bacterium P01_A01_bin.84]